MKLKYGFDIERDAICASFNRLINQVYKLLPIREENGDWQKPLSTVLEELAGMDRLFVDQQLTLFPLICKLEGLFNLTDESDFLLYRGVIFESLSLLTDIKKNVWVI